MWATPAPVPPRRWRIGALPPSKGYTHFGARLRRVAVAARADPRVRPPPAPPAGAFLRVVVVRAVDLTAIVLLVSVCSRKGAGSVPLGRRAPEGQEPCARSRGRASQ